MGNTSRWECAYEWESVSKQDSIEKLSKNSSLVYQRETDRYRERLWNCYKIEFEWNEEKLENYNENEKQTKNDQYTNIYIKTYMAEYDIRYDNLMDYHADCHTDIRELKIFVKIDKKLKNLSFT